MKILKVGCLENSTEKYSISIKNCISYISTHKDIYNYKNMSLCPYHKIDHKLSKNNGKIMGYDHNGCEYHGHCLHPIICTLHKSCPCNNPKRTSINK
jgi:hypothetical protein